MTDWNWRGNYAPRASSDTEGDVQRVLARLDADANDKLLLRLVANSAHSFRPFVLFSDSLITKAELPGEIRELVILHLAAVAETAYEWFEHVPMSRAAGVTDEQRAAIGAGMLDGFAADVRLALRLADVLAAGGKLTDDDWEAAQAAFGAVGAIDLLFTVAWWGAFVPTVLRGLDLRPKEADTR